MCTERQFHSVCWVCRVHGIVGITNAVVLDLEFQATILSEFAVVDELKRRARLLPLMETVKSTSAERRSIVSGMVTLAALKVLHVMY